MLVLALKQNEEIVIRVRGEIVAVVTLAEARNLEQARIGVTAPGHVAINRRKIDDEKYGNRDERLDAKEKFREHGRCDACGLPDSPSHACRAEQALDGEPCVPTSEMVTPLIMPALDAIAAGDRPEIHGRTEVLPALHELMDEQRSRVGG